ncbi:MAG TPA: hypothetical protein VKV19_06705 [Ktedonobacteraceae bacterium]|nr:hypothetical protein [Ktedonobacteraceae bacterium]
MTQAYYPKYPQAMIGSLYPTNYIVCVINDLQEAMQAVEAFQAAGFDASTVRLMKASELLEKIQELEQRKSAFQRFFSSFQDINNETGMEVYQLEAKQGHHILYIRTCAPSVCTSPSREIGRIREILGRYRAHTIKFFGTWSVEDIPPLHLQKH